MGLVSPHRGTSVLSFHDKRQSLVVILGECEVPGVVRLVGGDEGGRYHESKEIGKQLRVNRVAIRPSLHQFLHRVAKIGQM